MNKTAFCIAKFTALEVFHNRILWLALSSAIIAIGLGLFGHSLAITESWHIQTSFMSASLRFFAILIVCLVVVTTLSRELNDKSLEMVLSLAIKRSTYYFGKLLGFSFIIFSLAIFFGVCMLIATPFDNTLIWTLSLFCELFLVMCFSLLCAMTIRQIPIAIVTVLGFYFLTRTIGSAILMMNASLQITTSAANSMMSTVLQSISVVIPDLSHFTNSDWLIYGDANWHTLSAILLQTFIYSFLIISASLIDFYRKSV